MLSIGVAYRRERTSLNQGDVHMVTGLISMPLVSFQRNQGARAKAHADVAVAKAELAAARYLLDAQLTAARGEVVAAAARMRAYGADILPHFAENLGLLRRSFELGEIDLLALSTGRERFLRIQSDALEAQRDYLIAVAGLERVVGVEVWQESATEEGP